MTESRHDEGTPEPGPVRRVASVTRELQAVGGHRVAVVTRLYTDELGRPLDVRQTVHPLPALQSWADTATDEEAQ